MKRRLPSPEETLRILAHKRSRPARRPAPTAGKSLGKLVREMDQRFGQGPGALQARWLEIVGDQLARRTEPVKLIKSRIGLGATLELRVDGPSAAVIQHQGADILDRVNLFLGSGAVAKLRIVQGPVKFRPPPASAAPPRRRPAPPLDAADEARLEADLALLEDERLKASLARLGRAVLRGR